MGTHPRTAAQRINSADPTLPGGSRWSRISATGRHEAPLDAPSLATRTLTVRFSLPFTVRFTIRPKRVSDPQ
jgi:hypothetical protein